MLRDTLTAFEGQLREQGAGIMELLKQPGTETGAVRRLLIDFGGQAPDELVTWFCWQDGLTDKPWREPDRMAFVGAWRPISLSESLSFAGERRKRVRNEAVWGSGWVPLVEMEDKSVVADAASDSSEAPTYLYYTKDGPEPLGPSINSLVCAWIRFMNAGVYWDGTTKKWATKKPNSITTELLREVGYL